MLKLVKNAVTVSLLAGGMAIMGTAQADFSANMSRVVGASDSGHTVIDECGGGSDNFDGATATIENTQDGGSSSVKVHITKATANTYYTLWVSMKGKDSHGNNFGGSPITGGGATPLAASSNLDTLTAAWVGSGAHGANGFTTNSRGNGIVKIDLDFPLEGGAYPFNNIGEVALASAEAKRNITLSASPTAVVDPRQNGVGGPFMIRMVSHCQDGQGHGLSPGAREAWFQFP